jgi:hypothetical protein
LPLLAEEEHVVGGQDRDADLGDHGVVVPDDAREQRPATLERFEVVVAEFVLDGFRLPARVPELLESRRSAAHRGVLATRGVAAF